MKVLKTRVISAPLLVSQMSSRSQDPPEAPKGLNPKTDTIVSPKPKSLNPQLKLLEGTLG